MNVYEIITIVIEVLYAITIVSLVLLIISENRKPQKTISWILVLVFLPVIGLILYLCFGEEHRRLNSTQKKLNKNLKKLEAPYFNIPDSSEINPKYDKLYKMLEKIGRSPLLDGNQIEIYSDGCDMFEHFFRDIDNATHSVHIFFYKVMDDNIGEEFRKILIKKAQQGVIVRLIYDDVGSIKTSKKYFNELRKHGVQVAAFLPIRFPRVARRVNYRNHRKLAVIDGEIGYLGGMNVADNYIAPISWGTKGIWRDMQIRIEGRGCYGLQSTFLIDWFYSRKEKLTSIEYFPQLPSYGKNLMQIVSSGPTDINSSLDCGFIATINAAEKYLYIQTPYFAPTEGIMSALKVASHSGVDVRIMLPHQSDNAFVDAATFSYIDELLLARIKVYRYSAGFIHSKMILLDDELAVIGSANLDKRSIELNFETMAFIYDKNTALKAKSIFMKDVNDSETLNLEYWRCRSPWQKFFESTMRIMSPLF